MNRTPAGSHRPRHLDSLQLPSAWGAGFLPSTSLYLQPSSKFSSLQPLQGSDPDVPVTCVLQIAMALGNVSRSQAQFRNFDSFTFFVILCSFSLLLPSSLSDAPSGELLVASLTLLYLVGVITSHPVSSPTILWNGNVISLFCHIAPVSASPAVKSCLKPLRREFQYHLHQMLAFIHPFLTTQLVDQLNQFFTC